MPLARIKRDFLRECAEIVPLAVGQNDWKNLSKGVKNCLHLRFSALVLYFCKGVKRCLPVRCRGVSCMRHQRCKELFTGGLTRGRYVVGSVWSANFCANALKAVRWLQARLIVEVCYICDTEGVKSCLHLSAFCWRQGVKGSLHLSVFVVLEGLIFYSTNAYIFTLFFYRKHKNIKKT